MSPGERPLHDRVVLVTGAARGIGRAIAEGMAAAGAKVAVSDADGAAVEATARELAEGFGGPERWSAQAVDVTSDEQVAAWVDGVRDRWGRIDVLVNNAGIQLNQASAEMSTEAWQRVLDVDLSGVFRCSREAGRIMLGQGSGAIVNISSIAARFGMARRLPYAVSKAGVEALTRVLAVEWAEAGVRVNAIGPGYIETDLVRHAFEQGHIDREAIVAKIPMGRLAQPRSIADAAVFLASDAADYLSGQVLYVDGGYSVFK